MKVPEKQNSQRGNKGSQHIPKHVTHGRTISASTHATKKGPQSNWDNSKYTQAPVRMGSEHMHAPTAIQAPLLAHLHVLLTTAGHSTASPSTLHY